jgi:chromate transporter
MTILLLLCWEFFKIGLFAVGGGLSSIPFLMDLIEKYPDWYTQKELANMVAISEATPGPLGVNMATYVGFTVSGTIGAILASVAYVLPSFIVVLIIARFLGKNKENKNVKWVFSGLHPAVTGLIAAAGFSVIRKFIQRVF